MISILKGTDIFCTNRFVSIKKNQNNDFQNVSINEGMNLFEKLLCL